MELKDFISETLTQIVEGIEESNKNLAGKKSTGKVNPPQIGSINKVDGSGFFGFVDLHNLNKPIFLVNFNVVVEAREGKKGIEVVSSDITLGGQTKAEITSNYQTTLSFSIPLQYPQ